MRILLSSFRAGLDISGVAGPFGDLVEEGVEAAAECEPLDLVERGVEG